MVKELVIVRPDDWHLHLRDEDLLPITVNESAKSFARAIIMPNLVPPITNLVDAKSYKHRIMKALKPNLSFIPLMTLYMTEETDPREVEKGFMNGLISAVKLYPAGATTNSQSGVKNFEKIKPVLEIMAEIGCPLCIHGEVTDPDVDVFDREAVFIERHLIPLRQRHPGLRIVLEHITTEQAVDYVASGDQRLAATITPHHLHLNRNAMFVGGLKSDFYCLPVVKRECHRRALVKAATSGLPCFFLGTDSAPHPRAGKESACGCAGIFNAMHAMESYAAVFDQEGALDRLEAFASEFGPRFYGLPLNTDTIGLVRQPQTVPNQLTLPQGFLGELDSGEAPVFFHAGESLAWSVDLAGGD